MRQISEELRGTQRNSKELTVALSQGGDRIFPREFPHEFPHEFRVNFPNERVNFRVNSRVNSA